MASGSSGNYRLDRVGLPLSENPFWAKGNGKYYIGAIVDSQNQVEESDELNNSNTKEFGDSDSVTIHSVVGSSFGVVEDTIKAGQTVDVFFEIENLANVSTEELVVDFYLSDNNWISTNDFKITSQTIESIDPLSGTGSIKTTLALPGKTYPFWRRAGGGTYHLGMLVNGKDPANQFNTFKNYNNGQFIDYDTVDVAVPDLIDLTGESFNVIQETLEAGDTIDIEYSIANIEAGTAERFTVDFYLSTSEREWISNKDLKLGTQVVENLAGNSSTGTLTTSFTLPSEDSEFWLTEGNGSYLVGMIINPLGDPEGIDETFFRKNNQNQGEFIDKENIEVSLPNLVDLSGQFLNVVNEPLAPGNDIDVEFAIYNGEMGTADSFTVDFYYSKNDFISTGDVFLGSETITNLGGKSSTGIMMKTLSASNLVRQGGYIGMIVDGQKQIQETDEINNLNQGETIDLDGPDDLVEETLVSQADLIGQSFEVTKNLLTAGSQVDVNFAVYNKAAGDAGSFMVDVYVSSDENISPEDDFKLGMVSVDSLAGLTGTEVISESYTLPGEEDPFWLTQGDATYFIGTVIDSENTVAEISEDNNSNQRETFDYDGVKISNSSLVDLTGTYLTPVQETIAPGESFDIDFTIANKGNGNASSFNVEFYISKDKNISADEDIKLGDYNVNSLAANSNTGAITNFYNAPEADNEFWAEGDGTYYVGMVIDGENIVAETDELNNSNQGELLDYDDIKVVTEKEGELADLIGVDFNIIQETAVPGDTMEVEYEIYNQGDGKANNFAVGFYLFTEDYLNNSDGLALEDAPEVYFLFGDRDSALIDLEGNSSTGKMTATLELPTDWQGFSGSGNYYLGMAVDAYDDVDESDKLNNSLNGEMVDYERVFIDVI